MIKNVTPPKKTCCPPPKSISHIHPSSLAKSISHNHPYSLAKKIIKKTLLTFCSLFPPNPKTAGFFHDVSLRRHGSPSWLAANIAKKAQHPAWDKGWGKNDRSKNAGNNVFFFALLLSHMNQNKHQISRGLAGCLGVFVTMIPKDVAKELRQAGMSWWMHLEVKENLHILILSCT